MVKLLSGRPLFAGEHIRKSSSGFSTIDVHQPLNTLALHS
jgi:hypothetical protein